MKSYLPKVHPDEICSALQLCSVRQRGNEYFVAVKRLDGLGEMASEIPFADIANADEYEDAPIIRTYSSGHGFFNENYTKVFLLTVEKKGTKQIQFTGGSPLEEANKEVVFHENGEIKFHLGKIEENALIRTKNRTGVDVLEYWNELPLVDRALIENKDDDGNAFRRLVCLLHYIVKGYEGELNAQIGVEDVIGGEWYDVEMILKQMASNVAPNLALTLAPNLGLIIHKALEIVGATH